MNISLFNPSLQHCHHEEIVAELITECVKHGLPHASMVCGTCRERITVNWEKRIATIPDAPLVKLLQEYESVTLFDQDAIQKAEQLVRVGKLRRIGDWTYSR